MSLSICRRDVCDSPSHRPRRGLLSSSAIATREANASGAGSTEEDARQLKVVKKLLRDFEKRWKFTQRGCGAGGIAWLWRAACSCTCGGETDEERLERIVRAKVRRDVTIAYAWDVQLRELGLEAKERYLIELARFEQLTYVLAFVPSVQCECDHQPVSR